MNTLGYIKNMNLKTSFSTIRQWLWLIILCAMMGSSSAYIFTRLQPALYTAISKVELNQKRTNKHAIADSQQENPLALTYMQLFQSPDLLDTLLEELASKPTILALSMSQETDKGLLFVQVDSDNAQAAAFIANHLPKRVHEQQLLQQAKRYAKANDDLNERLQTLAQDISKREQSLVQLEAQNSYNHTELERERGTLSLQHISYQMLAQNLSLIEQAKRENRSQFKIVEAASIPQRATHPYLFQNTLLAAMIGSFIGLSAGILAEYLKKKQKQAHKEDLPIWPPQKSPQLHRTA
jgi:capsular polysaccharide biosynthesis protein